MTLAEELLPAFDVSDAVGRTVDAPPPLAWEALLDVDLLDVARRHPVVGLLLTARGLPELAVKLARREPLPPPPKRMRLRDFDSTPGPPGTFVLLGERSGEEIALGLVGRFWRPVIEFAQVPAAEFEAFDEPGYAKTVYALSATPLEDGRTLIAATMRTATTDERSRRRFRRYWNLGVGAGAHVLVAAVLELARDDAIGRHGSGSGATPPPVA